MATSNLFKPLSFSPAVKTIGHRIAMAPLTRYRADDEYVPLPMVAEYYAQRASSLPGQFIVTEATFISKEAGGYANVSGIYTDAQIEAWKKVVDGVHAKGGVIFLQLWALGRTANAKITEAEGFPVEGPSAIPMPDEGSPVPKEMSVADIKARIADYATAAKNAVERAGFDGVEIHAANGFLPDQFLQDVSNKRTDSYGGSIENRSRFVLETIEEVSKAVGATRVGIRLSPWNRYQGMRMADPIPQFSHLVSQIQARFPLAYVHLVAGTPGSTADDGDLDFAFEHWKGPVLINCNLSPETAKELVDVKYKDRDVVAVFGRWFISNPDLPFRIREAIELTQYDWTTFYTPKEPKGYIDQPFSEEFKKYSASVKVQA